MLGAGRPQETENLQEMTTRESSLLLGVEMLVQALMLGVYALKYKMGKYQPMVEGPCFPSHALPCASEG